MPDDRTQQATPGANPVATGEYVPESTPDPASTRPTGPPAGGRPRGDAGRTPPPGRGRAHRLSTRRVCAPARYMLRRY